MSGGSWGILIFEVVQCGPEEISWFSDLLSSNRAGFNRHEDMFASLNIVVRPKSVDFAKDLSLASISQHNPCQGIVRLDFVHVDQGIVFRVDISGISVGISPFVSPCHISVLSDAGFEQGLPFLCL